MMVAVLQPNLYAANLARGRTRLLGLLVSDIMNPFIAEIARAIRQAWWQISSRAPVRGPRRVNRPSIRRWNISISPQ